MADMKEEYKYVLPDLVAEDKIEAVIELLNDDVGKMFIYFQEKKTVLLDPKI